MKWLLESDVFDDDLLPMLDELKRQNIEYKVADHMTSIHPERVQALFPPDDCVVFYGSLGMSRIVKLHTSWVPGIFCELPHYECVYYYPRIHKYLLNSNYVMLPFGELTRRKEFLLDLFGKDGKIFIRPSSPFKIFGGKVIDSKNWESDIKFVQFYNVEAEKVVVVAPPKVVTHEWRVVVVDGKAISGSQYIKNDEIESGPCPKDVMIYAQWVLCNIDYKPDRAWCLDVCRTDDDFLHVLEVGAFSTCGLYQCPMEPIIREVSRVAQEEWEEIHSAME